MTVKTKENILQLSYQYQREWRFEKDKALILEAKELFPDWNYADLRLAWHARPEFDRDPAKSKTQPRQPLHLPRDPNYIPKQETMDSLCFVTASGSDQPYFDLSVQLLESLKATRWYKDVPIKILDCGLTQEDADYLRQRFNAEVKDPGWDMDPEKLSKEKQGPINGWKGAISRPYIQKHFPGYKYYFWSDTDNWIQDERAMDKLVCLCEEQGIAGVKETQFPQFMRNDPFNVGYFRSIPKDYLDFMKVEKGVKTTLNPSIFCISDTMAQRMAEYTDHTVSVMPTIIWGIDTAIFNYTFFKEVENGKFFDDDNIHYIDLAFKGGFFDEAKNIYQDIERQHVLGVLSLGGHTKGYGYYILSSNTSAQDNIQALHLSQQRLDHETLDQHRAKHGWTHGTYFYRTYLDPELVYGKMEEWL
ncbi:MAG: hypothetical protein H6850_01795 [Alphaproteobacteria bacterium]|nr:MAG: hypothetical protein H6850_01795 [Alphaproteobacteria bacterium]